MRTSFLIVIQAILLAGVFPSSLLHAQNPPADFSFSATTGGTAPWSTMERITIDNTGQAKYVRYKTGGAPAVLAESTFTVSTSGLQQLWQAIQDSSFFTVDPTWEDTTVHGGSFARVTITANGVTHQVSVKNIAQPKIQSILTALNTVVPPDLQLQYTPPEKFDYTPKDPCSSSYGALGGQRGLDFKTQSSRDPKLRAFPGPYLSTISRVPPIELSHPGVVVACDVSLQDAIANGWASLSSKGDFFGDDVSITITNQNHPPCPTIEITLYLEFWGPLATESNVNQVLLDIAKKWNGATTSGGQKIQVGFKVRTDISADAPPNTPGYDEIQLVGKGFRSYVTGKDYGTNYGTGSGVWEVGGDPGEYAHEAGHLMGLPDRYDDFKKQADGSWKDDKTGQTFTNDDDFANYAKTKYPDANLNDIKNTLKDADTYSIPWDGSENDLMGNLGGSLKQSDIDQITAHPGLLVHIPDGTILVNRAADEQDLAVTHDDDIYAGPGQTRTLNGIYAACIDHFSGVPSYGGLFDVAPPLSKWTGVRAAGYLAKLLHYVDSVGLYCDFDFATQEAIWRLSDNTLPLFGVDVDSLLASAGITIGNEILDFPRLDRSSSTDSSSHLYIPDQLYVANIVPALADGQIGNLNSFTAHLSYPQDAPAPVGVGWSATGPDGAPASIAAVDSTASLTPTQSGVYDITLRISLNDSLHGQKTITSDREALVIVPDEYTETFEHPNIADKYPWQSYGDLPWTISNNYPETGSYAAQPAAVANGKSSTLGIDVSLPSDGKVVFSLRSMAEFLINQVAFYIDSTEEDLFGEVSDWAVHAENIPAGIHRLTWKYTNFSSLPSNSIWLDNIFFPGNVVVTSVTGTSVQIPKVFALEQNYPNPFNPTTAIRYQLPAATSVSLIVYDVLGREVRTLVNEQKPAGYYTVIFDGSGLASGVYFYRIKAGDFVETRKLTLIR